MKRLIAAVVLLILIICAVVSGNFAVNHYYSELEVRIDNCINTAYSDSAYTNATELEEYWIGAEKVLKLFVNRSIVEQISESITVLPYYAQSSDEDSYKFLSACALLKLQLLHMRNAEIFSEESIF